MPLQDHDDSGDEIAKRVGHLKHLPDMGRGPASVIEIHLRTILIKDECRGGQRGLGHYYKTIGYA